MPSVAALLQVTGLMSLVAMSIGSIERLDMPNWLKPIVRGIPFGAAACIAVLMPTVLPDGTVLNGRSLLLAFSAAFGGPFAFITATTIAVVGYIQLTDNDVLNTIRPTIAAGFIGSAWRFMIYPGMGLKVASLVLLGLMVSALALLLLLVPSGKGPDLLQLAYPPTLIASLIAALILGRFIERELRHFKREQLWQREAFTDALTALPNKRAFFEVTANLAKSKTAYSVIVIDIDHFKNVNDTYGHDTGDPVLKNVADVIADSLPANGQAFRLGGEEFVVVLLDTTSARAYDVAETTRRSVEAAAVMADKMAVRTTVSIGIADSSNDINPSDVVSAADTALYAAKENGRNRIMTAASAMHSPAA